jgi:hypothetical protein
MHYLGGAVLIAASLIWVFGFRAIMRPQVGRPRHKSLISMLRPEPISFKNITPNQKRSLFWLILTWFVLAFLGLGLINGLFD